MLQLTVNLIRWDTFDENRIVFEKDMKEVKKLGDGIRYDTQKIQKKKKKL